MSTLQNALNVFQQQAYPLNRVVEQTPVAEPAKPQSTVLDVLGAAHTKEDSDVLKRMVETLQPMMASGYGPGEWTYSDVAYLCCCSSEFAAILMPNGTDRNNFNAAVARAVEIAHQMAHTKNTLSDRLVQAIFANNPDVGHSFL